MLNGLESNVAAGGTGERMPVNEVMRRMLPAGLLALALHGGLLFLHVPQPEIPSSRPALKKRRSVTVSLQRIPPPAEKKSIRQELPPVPDLVTTKHKPLSKLPPPAKQEPAEAKAVAAAPPVEKKIIRRHLRPVPEKAGRKHKPLTMLPPQAAQASVKPVPVGKQTVLPTIRPTRRKRKIVRPVRKATVLPVLKKKTAVPPPVRKKIIRRHLPPPPKITPVVQHKPLDRLPPVQNTVPILLDLPTALPPDKEVAPEPAVRVSEDPYPDVPWETVPSSIHAEQVEQEREPIQVQPVMQEAEDSYRDIPWETVPTTSLQSVYQQENRQATEQRIPPPSQQYNRAVTVTSGRNDALQTGGSGPVRKAAPLYQSNPPPEYPRLAKRRGLEGVVIVEALIDIDGRVADLGLFAGSGHGILDKTALKAVRRWRFTPGTVGGRPKRMWVKVPVRFKLQ